MDSNEHNNLSPYVGLACQAICIFLEKKISLFLPSNPPSSDSSRVIRLKTINNV